MLEQQAQWLTIYRFVGLIVSTDPSNSPIEFADYFQGEATQRYASRATTCKLTNFAPIEACRRN